jgi:hypothetical protein
VNCFKTLTGGCLAAILTIAPAAWAQSMPQGNTSVVSASESTNTMDQELAQKISQAWSEGKDASGAAAFQENGEIALSEGNPQQARRYFEAAEHELARLHPMQTSQGNGAVY